MSIFTKERLYYFYKNYTCIVSSLVAYAIVSFFLSQYVAILCANLLFLAFFQIFDFKDGLFLDKVRDKFQETSEVNVNTKLPRTSIKNVSMVGIHPSTSPVSEHNGEILLESKPKDYFNHVSFVSAFQLKYIAEDTDKFIASFSERVKHQFFTNIALFLVILVIFSSGTHNAAPAVTQSITSNSATPDQLNELNKTTLAIVGAVINFLFLVRPYLYCRERNKGFLSN